MVCASCGATNPDDLHVCARCGRALVGSRATESVETQFILTESLDKAAAPRAARRTQAEIGVLSPPPANSQFATEATSPASGSGPQPGFDSESLLAARYRLEALLGQGGMGAVFKAYDAELDRTVALKLIRPELAAKAEIMQRFKQELLLASKISHKNILRIYDLGESEGIKFITMAFIEGSDLATLMEHSGRLPLDRALSFTTQLCEALDAAHREGVVHRDLKPQNILIDQSDRLYVSDFGLAKSLAPESSSMTRTGQLLGTPRYMSPEQIEGKDVDSRSDLYSLGLILFEVFTERFPFRGESALQIMFQRMTAAPEDPKTLRPDLPDYMANIILKCLEKEPAQRYQNASEILADIEAHNAPRVATSPPANTIKIGPKKLSRFSWVALAGVPLAVALLFAIPSTRHLILRPPAPAAAPSQPAIEHYMAILPLHVVGSAEDAGYLASGVTDLLTAKLSGLKDVYVAPPSAVTAALKQNDPRKIARALGVKLLLEGTLTTNSNGDVAITITLDDPANPGRNLMHQVFQGGRADLLTLEDRIFAKLVDSLRIKQGNDERARTTTRPTLDTKAYEYYMKGRDLSRETESSNDLERAIGFFNQAVRLDPRFAEAYASLADVERRMWNQTNDDKWIQQALTSARLAQALNDNLPEVHFALGSIYTTMGRSAEGIAELQRALQLAPNSDQAFRGLGTVYLKANREQEALAAYTRATEINPYLWTNFNSLGNAYFKLGQNDRALAAYQHIIELDPARAEGWEALGATYYRMGRWSKSLSNFQKAVELNPKPLFYSNLGNLYFFLGRYDEAAKVFEKAVALDPDSDDFRVNLADAYRWSGQTIKASATYDQVISLAFKSIRVDPRNAGSLANLALSYAKKGDSNQALKFIARAREIEPKDNGLMYDQATIYALAGQTARAMASLEEALNNGYSILEVRSDPELKGLHSLPEFNRLGDRIAEKPQ